MGIWLSNSSGDGSVDSLYGGSSFSGSNVYQNSVTVSGGTINHAVYAGYSSSGNAGGTGYYDDTLATTRGNQLSITGGTITTSIEHGGVYGGYSISGSANYNMVGISGGTITTQYDATQDQEKNHDVDIAGGYTASSAMGEDIKSVSYNKVTISGGEFTQYSAPALEDNKYVNVYGGYASGSATASGNSVEIASMTSGSIGRVYGGDSKSGSAGGTAYYGDASVAASTWGNSVSISGGTINCSIYGGSSESGSANFNTLNISGGTIDASFPTTDELVVAGGYTASTAEENFESASNNQVSISSGTFTQGAKKINVYGGKACKATEIPSSNPKSYTYDATANANANRVEISGMTGGSVLNVYGGYSDKGSANFNAVDISNTGGGTVSITGGIYAGCASETIGNSISVAAGQINGYVLGGSATNTAAGNSVSITGGTINAEIDGGSSSGGSAGGTAYYGDTTVPQSMWGNNVSISGGIFKNSIYGGYSDGGSANFNTVSISDSAIINASGKDGCLEIGGGITHSDDAEASNNRVTINGGSFKPGGEGIIVYGGGCVEAATASANSVVIRGMTSTSSVSVVYGGYSTSGSAGGTGDNAHLYDTSIETQTVGAGNYVSISEGNITGGVYGGYVDTGSGSANYNTVNISGGTISGDVYGGRSSEGDANGNIVTISGGSFPTNSSNIKIYGGNHENDGTPGKANANTVIISGMTQGFVKEVYGGFALNGNAYYNAVIWKNGAVSSVVSGGENAFSSGSNTLVVYDATAKKETATVQRFQNYLFVLNGTTNTTDAVLTASSEVAGIATSTKFGVTIEKKNAPSLTVGNTVTLLSAATDMTDLSSTSIVNSADYILSDSTDGLKTVNQNAYNAIKDTVAEGNINRYEFTISQPTLKTIVAEVAKVTPTVVVTDVRQISDSSYVNFRSQINDVSLRMGELRSSNTDGAWARLYGGAYKLGSGMKEKSVTIQVGADRWFDANSYVGLTAAYTKADDTLTSGDNKQKNWNVGFYGGYVADSGLFVDAIVKHGQIKNDFSLRYE